MFGNLKAEMARQNMNIKTLSERTGIKYQTLYAKIKGTSEFSLGHCLKIQRAVNPELTLDYLFKKEEV